MRQLYCIRSREAWLLAILVCDSTCVHAWLLTLLFWAKTDNVHAMPVGIFARSYRCRVLSSCFGCWVKSHPDGRWVKSHDGGLNPTFFPIVLGVGLNPTPLRILYKSSLVCTSITLMELAVIPYRMRSMESGIVLSLIHISEPTRPY